MRSVTGIIDVYIVRLFTSSTGCLFVVGVGSVFVVGHPV